MKKTIRSFLILSVVFYMIFMVKTISAQGPPPPPGESGKGTSQNQSAPLDGGLSVMLLFASGLTLREWNKSKRKQEN